jgi:hypothetical protein
VLELVLTGKTLGSEESHVTEFVRSRTVGAVEKVPIAMKFPVSCKLPTLIELGIMVSDSRGSGAGDEVTSTVAVASATLPSGLVQSAVMVEIPGLTPAASPVELTVATVGMLELQVRLGESVTFICSVVVPTVPSAMNWAVWPDAESD